MTNSELIKKVQEPFINKDIPEIRTGMEVEVSQKIVE